MFDVIRGPLLWVAFIVFFGGILFQTFQFFTLTRKKERVFVPVNCKTEGRWSLESMKQWFESLRASIIGTHPVMTILTLIFHCCLFVTPLFLLAHNILLDESWGISMWSFSESTTDILTVIFLVCGLFFLFRRIFLRRVRAITTVSDYLILFIAIAPFLSGYMAYHQWFNYKAILFVHILAGEVMLIVIPFTQLGHMLFFFLYRLLIGSEYSFGQGTRSW